METLSPKCKKFLTSKIRDGWRFYSESRKDCLKIRKCVACKSSDAKIFADHIDPVGRFVPEENPYIKRMFCDRSNLQPMCKQCHSQKTKAESKTRSKSK